MSQYPSAAELASELEEIKRRLDMLERRFDEVQGGVDVKIPSLEREQPAEDDGGK